jgi:hypothetical protein
MMGNNRPAHFFHVLANNPNQPTKEKTIPSIDSSPASRSSRLQAEVNLEALGGLLCLCVKPGFAVSQQTCAKNQSEDQTAKTEKTMNPSRQARQRQQRQQQWQQLVVHIKQVYLLGKEGSQEDRVQESHLSALTNFLVGPNPPPQDAQGSTGTGQQYGSKPALSACPEQGGG